MTAKPPRGRGTPSCLQLWQWALFWINYTLDFQKNVKYVKYLKYIQEFYTPVCYCWDIDVTFHDTKHDAEQNKLWLVAPIVIQTSSRVVFGQEFLSIINVFGLNIYVYTYLTFIFKKPYVVNAL